MIESSDSERTLEDHTPVTKGDRLEDFPCFHCGESYDELTGHRGKVRLSELEDLTEDE